jgi:branched-chain amino acid transport system permease protein
MTFFGQLLVNGLMLGAVYALAAVAYTLVYGVVRLINFAFGELFMVGAFVTVSLMLTSVRLFGVEVVMPGLPFVVAAILAIVFVSALGLFIERVAYRPLRNAPRLAPLITAIAVSVLLQSVAQTVWGAEELRFPEIPMLQHAPWVVGGVYVSAKEVLVLAVAVIAMVGLTLLVNHTTLGRAMRATASDMDAAYLVGIPVNRIIAATFVIGSGLAALAGLLYAQAYGFAHPTMGFLPGLKALTAAVLGGIGSFTGAALGGVLLALIESFGAGYLPYGSAYKDALSFGLLILLLYFRPQGLLGRKELNEEAQGSLLSYSRPLRLPAWITRVTTQGYSYFSQLLPHKSFYSIALLVIAASFAFTVTSDYWLRVLIVIVIYGLLATGLNIVVGLTGLLDLGYVAFWAIGAYFTSILFILVLRGIFGIQPAEVWWLFYLNLIAGGLVAATFGLVLGYPTLRLRGDYLAIMTLGFGEIIRIIATNWVDLTRGPMGIRGIPAPRLFEWSLAPPKLLYLLLILIASAILFTVSRLVTSYVGRGWVAIRDDERAAEAMGVDTSRFKLYAYAFGGLVGGSVGVFFAHFQQYISPNSFTVFDNIVLMMLIVLGGLGTLVGPFIGAAIWILFLQVSQGWSVVQAFPESRYAMLGILLIVLMIYQPQGLAARARPSLVLAK